MQAVKSVGRQSQSACRHPLAKNDEVHFDASASTEVVRCSGTCKYLTRDRKAISIFDFCRRKTVNKANSLKQMTPLGCNSSPYPTLSCDVYDMYCYMSYRVTAQATEAC